MKENKTIEIKAPERIDLQITIEGQGDLVLNKMNDRTARELADTNKGKTKSKTVPNEWEDVITSLHWYNGKPKEFTEEELERNLDPKVNAPCLTAFGLKKSFADSVVRNGYDKYATKFNANVNIIAAKDNLVPIRFVEHNIDEKLMSPRKGHPVLARLNRFSGWSAQFVVEITGKVFSVEDVVNVISDAGFGLGIGSGRSSGYGRYKIAHMEQITDEI